MPNIVFSPTLQAPINLSNPTGNVGLASDPSSVIAAHNPAPTQGSLSLVSAAVKLALAMSTNTGGASFSGVTPSVVQRLVTPRTPTVGSISLAGSAPTLAVAGVAAPLTFPRVMLTGVGGDQSYGCNSGTGYPNWLTAANGTAANTAIQTIGAYDIAILSGVYEGWDTSGVRDRENLTKALAKQSATYTITKNNSRATLVFYYEIMNVTVAGNPYAQWQSLVSANNWFLYPQPSGGGTATAFINYSAAWPGAIGNAGIGASICGANYGTTSSGSPTGVQGPARTFGNYASIKLLTRSYAGDTRFSFNAQMGSPSAAGIFLDECFVALDGDTTTGNASLDGVTIAPGTQQGGGFPGLDTVQPVMARGNHNMFDQLQTMLALANPGKVYYNFANFGQYANKYQFGTATLTAGLENTLHGGLLESVLGAGAPSWECFQTGNPNTGGSYPSGWPNLLANYYQGMDFCQAPKLVGLGTKLPATDGSSSASWPVGAGTTLTSVATGTTLEYQLMRYGLCTALLDDGYFAPSVAGYDYSKVRWYDEYGDDSLTQVNVKRGYLGSPLTARPTSPTWSQGPLGVWSRRFDNGIAIVNPRGNGAQTVSLPGTYQALAGTQQPSINNGAKVTSVSVPDGDGRVLLWVGQTVINVSTVTQLVNAVSTANASGYTDIVLADGTYTLTAFLNITGTSVHFRSASGNRTACIVRGDAMSSTASVGFIFRVDANYFSVSDMTLQLVGFSLVQIVGEDNVGFGTINNCVLQNSYQHMVKCSIDNINKPGNSAHDWTITNNLFGYTAASAPNYYTGGIDGHGGKNFLISNNIFQNIASPATNVAEHAIHLWDGSADGSGKNLIQSNLIVNCDRGIGYGMETTLSNGLQAALCTGGLIINNEFIHANNGAPFADVSIDIQRASGTQVYNNSGYLLHPYSNFIETRYTDTTGIRIQNNLSNKAIQLRDGSTVAANDHNVTNAVANWFLDPTYANPSNTLGPLGLVSAVAGVVNSGVAASGVLTDFVGTTRPQGSAYDIGACEYIASAFTVTITTASPLPSATAGTAYSTSLAATGGVPPYNWAITSNTPNTGNWLTINGSTAVLSGTPSTAETETIGIQVTDSATGVGAGGFQFFDDFLGGTLNPTDWIALSRDSDQSNGELNWYLPTNATVSGGNLNMTAKVQSLNGRAYTSTMVQWRTFSFLYGTVEFRAKLCGGTGTWPALWLLGANCEATNPTSPDNIGTCNWPNPGSDEVDIVEIANSNYTQTRQNLINNAGTNSSTINLGFDSSAGFHVYQLVWAPNSLIWKVDGVTTKTVNSAPNQPMFLIMNIAMGGIAGAVNNSTLPVTMQIDYVKVT